MLIFYPPYVRGLYFEENILPAAIFTCIIFTAFIILKAIQQKKILNTSLDYIVLGIAVIYALAIITSYSTRLAVSEWIKYGMYFFIFIMLSNLANTAKRRIAVLLTIIASAMGVCIIGIDSLAGKNIIAKLNSIFEIYTGNESFFFDLEVGGRVFSTLQYPGALAAYTMAMFIVAVGIASFSRRNILKVIAGFSGFFFLFTFVLTQSRSGYLLIPFVSIAFVLLQSKGNKLEVLMNFIAISLPSIICSAIYQFMTENYAGNKIWALVLVGAVISAAMAVLSVYIVAGIEKIKNILFDKYSVKKIKIITVVGVLFIGIAISLWGAITALSNQPLMLKNTNTEKAKKVVTRWLYLEPNAQYTLEYDVSSYDKNENPSPYRIRISSRDFEGIIKEKDKEIKVYNGEVVPEKTRKTIDFEVPADSAVVGIHFINENPGTGAEFDNAKVFLTNGIQKPKKLLLKSKLIPESLIARYETAKATRSIVERGYFLRDGLKMFAARPILGGGGGAWKTLYTKYQSYNYSSKETHNYFINLIVECGIIGLFAIIALIIFSIIMFIKGTKKYFRDRRELAILNATLFVAFMGMLAHSISDFNFSLVSVFLLFWQLAALFNGLYIKELTGVSDDKEKVKKKDKNKDYKKVQVSDKWVFPFRNLEGAKESFIETLTHPLIYIIPIVILVIFASIFITARVNAVKGIKALEQEEIDVAEGYFKKACFYDPIKPEYRIGFSPATLDPVGYGYLDLLMVRKSKQQENTPETVQKQLNNLILENLKTTKKYGYYRSEILNRAGGYYLRMGDAENGLSLRDRAVELRPLSQHMWLFKAEAYNSVYNAYVENEMYEMADELSKEIVNIAQEAAKKNSKNMIPFVLENKNMRIIEFHTLAQKLFEEGKVEELSTVMNNFFISYPEMDVDNNNIPDQWSENSNDGVEISFDGKALIAKNNEKETKFITSRGIELLKGYTYTLEIITQDANSRTIPFEITDLTTDPNVLYQQGNKLVAQIEVTEEDEELERFLKLGIEGTKKFESIRLYVQ